MSEGPPTRLTWLLGTMGFGVPFGPLRRYQIGQSVSRWLATGMLERDRMHLGLSATGASTPDAPIRDSGMPRDHRDSLSVEHGYTVHLMEHSCDGWSIAVTRAGRAAAFVVHHRDPEGAVEMAKTLAVTEGADLEVLRAGRGYEFVPAARVAAYVLPINTAPANGCLRTSFPAIRPSVVKICRTG